MPSRVGLERFFVLDEVDRFQTPIVASEAAGFGEQVVQLHSSAYRNPRQLPDGPVLVVGSGNSGMQIAEELAASRSHSRSVPLRPRCRSAFSAGTCSGGSPGSA